MAKRILVIDDEKSIRDALAGILSDEGFEPVCADGAEAGLAVLDREEIDLVLLDIWMPGMDGMAALERIRKEYPGLPVIMVSGHGNIETAVKATRMGAYDFIEKPPSYDKIVVAVNNGLRLSRLEEENVILRTREKKKPELVGDTPPIRELKKQIEMVAPTSSWVLIRGEHGTGKEVVAQTIHRLSACTDKPMVEVNCAAIPEELIESELFGHEKGAFTGANSRKHGKFDLADGGMLFLDEIGDMSLKTQAKILRILQEQNFERVGGSRTISVDVRVLAATNKNLEEEIEKGSFRADLFYRLNVFPLVVPPLRDRLADIPLLVEAFLKNLARKGFGERSFDEGAIELMMTHSWPGNVRELKNFVERAVIMSREGRVTRDTVMLLLRPVMNGASPPLPQPSSMAVDNFKEARREFEREYLAARLAANNGNISKTAEEIGLERSHLHRKLKGLGVESDG